MISFASLISADSVHNNSVGQEQSAPTNTNASPQRNIGLHIQRNASCACGGGCPRCVQKSELQGSGARATSPAGIYETAAAGVHGPGAQLPHLDRIQASFGTYDVTNVRGHVDGAASQAAQSINASAYTLDGHVAFDGQPDIFTAAHEAAHIVQQRAGVQLKGGVGEIGDRFEQHADAVAAEVVAGRSAEPLLDQHTPDKLQTKPAQRRVVQREALKKVGEPVSTKDSATRAEAATTVNEGLAKVGDNLVAGLKKVRLTICDDTEFVVAWQNYVDREGHSGNKMEAGLTGFVDPTYPGGQMGFVLKTGGVGTAIHETMHQHAAESFTTEKVGRAINEGTTELFTRVVIGYAGGKIERTVYEKEKTAMLRLQGISGLTALAQWYFRGDRSAVEKALGPKLEKFTEAMGREDMDEAIGAL